MLFCFVFIKKHMHHCILSTNIFLALFFSFSLKSFDLFQNTNEKRELIKILSINNWTSFLFLKLLINGNPSIEEVRVGALVGSGVHLRRSKTIQTQSNYLSLYIDFELRTNWKLMMFLRINLWGSILYKEFISSLSLLWYGASTHQVNLQ